MLSGVEFQGREIEFCLDEIRVCLKKVEKPSYSIEKKKSIFLQINRLIESVHTSQEAYLLELKIIKDEEIKKFSKADYDDKVSQLKNLIAEYEWKKNELKRKDQLLSTCRGEEDEENNRDGSSAEKMNKTKNMNRVQLVMHGNTIQDKTQESINKIKDIVQEAETIGIQAAEKLDEQTSQMNRIHEKMNDVEYNLSRAKKTIKTIAKNAATDRCAQILCCLTFVFLILAVVLIALPR